MKKVASLLPLLLLSSLQAARAAQVGSGSREAGDTKTVVLRYYDGANHFTVTKTASVGEEIDPSLPYFGVPSPARVTVTEETDTVDVTCVPMYPFDDDYYVSLRCYPTGEGDRNVAYVSGDSISTRSNRTDETNVWLFRRVPDTQDLFYIYNAATMGALHVDSDAEGTPATFSVTPTPFRIVRHANGGFCICHPANDLARLNDVDGQLKFRTSIKDLHQWPSEFVVEYNYDFWLQEVTYVFEDGRPGSVTFTGYSAEGVTPSVENVGGLDFYSGLAVTSGAVSEENPVVTVACESNFPFEISTAEAPAWQLLKTRGREDCHVVRSADEHVSSGGDGTVPSRFTAENVTTYGRFNNGLWRFERIGVNAFKVCNKESGKALSVASANDGVQATLAAEGTAFFVSPNGEGFNLQVPGAAACCLGDHLDGGFLGTWSSAEAPAADGSRFTVVSADRGDIVAMGQQALLNDMAATSSFVGGYTPTAVAAFSSVALSTVTGLDKAKARIDAAPANFNVIEPGTYYKIKSACGAEGVKPFMSSATATANTAGRFDDTAACVRNVTRTDGSDAPSCLWQFEGDDANGYLVRNANAQLALGAHQDGAATVQLALSDQQAERYKVAAVAGSLVKQRFQETSGAGRSLNATGGAGTEQIGASADVTGDTAHWFVQPVTEIPLNVYADTNWASVKFPFAVRLPEGLTAYRAVSAEGDQLQLRSIADGLIPAGEAVLVASDQAAAPVDGVRAYTLAIVADAPAVEGNLLEGTTAARTGYGENAVYVLASDGHAGGMFKKNGTVATLPANKAYLPVASVQNGQPTAALQFHFGSGTTAIEGAPAEQAAEEVCYDLSGRRVCYPARGIYVTAAGKKVFIP